MIIMKVVVQKIPPESNRMNVRDAFRIWFVDRCECVKGLCKINLLLFVSNRSAPRYQMK